MERHLLVTEITLRKIIFDFRLKSARYGHIEDLVVGKQTNYPKIMVFRSNLAISI